MVFNSVKYYKGHKIVKLNNGKYAVPYRKSSIAGFSEELYDVQFDSIRKCKEHINRNCQNISRINKKPSKTILKA